MGLVQVRWTTKHVYVLNESPIFGWPERLIKEALRALSSEGSLAVKQTDWPLTLKDLDDTFRDQILEPIIPTLTQRGLVLLRPLVPWGRGCSMKMQSLAFALSCRLM